MGEKEQKGTPKKGVIDLRKHKGNKVVVYGAIAGILVVAGGLGYVAYQNFVGQKEVRHLTPVSNAVPKPPAPPAGTIPKPPANPKGGVAGGAGIPPISGNIPPAGGNQKGATGQTPPIPNLAGTPSETKGNNKTGKNGELPPIPGLQPAGKGNGAKPEGAGNKMPPAGENGVKNAKNTTQKGNDLPPIPGLINSGNGNKGGTSTSSSNSKSVQKGEGSELPPIPGLAGNGNSGGNGATKTPPTGVKATGKTTPQNEGGLSPIGGLQPVNNTSKPTTPPAKVAQLTNPNTTLKPTGASSNPTGSDQKEKVKKGGAGAIPPIPGLVGGAGGGTGKEKKGSPKTSSQSGGNLPTAKPVKLAKIGGTTQPAHTKPAKVYFIQVASLLDHDHLSPILKRKLKGAGLKYRLVSRKAVINGEMVSVRRVLVGPFNSKGKAQQVLERIKGEINPDAFIWVRRHK